MRGLILLCNIFITAVFLAELWVRYPCNHSYGVEGYFYIYCTINVFFLILECFKNSRFSYLCLVFIMLGGSLCYVIDKYNVLVDYDEWLSRGMPAWGEEK